MYCIKCGVQLADTEKQCPLCQTRVFHPDLPRSDAPPLYPQADAPLHPVHPWGLMLVISILFLLPMSICLVCDLSFNGTVNWSGYVIGALVVLYTIAVLPSWFRHPNPVIFVPVAFAVILLYLLYIDLATGGGWFLSFAFPVTGCVAVIVTTVVTLMRYIRKGRLYIFGGALIALGGFMLLLEFLIQLTFGLGGFGTWSPYPLIVFCLLGLLLILIAICRPLRESLSKKFFL